jgi:outer membrane lipoprotein carrier protein
MTPYFLSVLYALSSFSLHAAPPAEEALRQFMDRVQTFSARFEQLQKDENGVVLQASAGQLWLARPGKFRWAYEQPYEQLLVCDGETIWMYDPDLRQVTVRPAQQALGGTPAELLASPAALERQFTVTDGGMRDAARIVLLKPRSADSDFKSIELWLQQGVPLRLQFEDHIGSVTEIRFSDAQSNRKPDRALFTFKIPKGVDVIQGMEPQSR